MIWYGPAVENIPGAMSKSCLLMSIVRLLVVLDEDIEC